MKKTLCFALAALTALQLAAPAAPALGAAGFQPSLDTDTAGELRVAGSYNNFEALEAVFDDFNDVYPEVELSYVKLDDYNNMIGVTLEGSEAPDVYVTYSWMIGREAYAAALDHAENLADPALGIDMECLRPNILSKVGEETLMLPIFSTTHGMLVNLDLFVKEGIAVPTTYEELVSACRAFREKGYASPVMGYAVDSIYMYAHTLAFPYFCAAVAGDPEAVEKLNGLDPAAGEYMRPALELTVKFIEDGCIDPEACMEIEDNYEGVILRFLEGDVPMMICTGDTVSGTKKRESQSEAFSAHPFTYYFAPVPVSAEGGYFLDTPSLQFSVNKDSAQKDMANEFMRFLFTSDELSRMAQIKRLVSPTKDLSFDSVYAPFGEVPEDRVISPEEFGLADAAVVQFRGAANAVAAGTMTVDEAVAAYGTFENK